VKANPNPHIKNLMKEEGCGADCSSLPELILAERVGIKGDMIMLILIITLLRNIDMRRFRGNIES
jgi:diaminopimelate decarboxylase